ncbi:hypothetical protein HanRHA438_Chr03g0149561 [Helianthus annuus]|nr:hypothetical protein HanRHA438_Chr03g0149561 [Helianthus annuus]
MQILGPNKFVVQPVCEQEKLERDYPSNKLSNHREHRCNFQKLGTICVILQNHRDYPCILLYY